LPVCILLVLALASCGSEDVADVAGPDEPLGADLGLDVPTRGGAMAIEDPPFSSTSNLVACERADELGRNELRRLPAEAVEGFVPACFVPGDGQLEVPASGESDAVYHFGVLYVPVSLSVEKDSLLTITDAGGVLLALALNDDHALVPHWVDPENEGSTYRIESLGEDEAVVTRATEVRSTVRWNTLTVEGRPMAVQLSSGRSPRAVLELARRVEAGVPEVDREDGTALAGEASAELHQRGERLAAELASLLGQPVQYRR
jgi:hypothetical protein